LHVAVRAMKFTGTVSSGSTGSNWSCDRNAPYGRPWIYRLKLGARRRLPKMPKIACQYLNSSKQTGWHGIVHTVILEFSGRDCRERFQRFSHSMPHHCSPVHHLGPFRRQQLDK
jgi:hypothetical protein